MSTEGRPAVPTLPPDAGLSFRDLQDHHEAIQSGLFDIEGVRDVLIGMARLDDPDAADMSLRLLANILRENLKAMQGALDTIQELWDAKREKPAKSGM